MENKTIKRFITFTPRMAEMVEEIMQAKGHMSFSSVIHQAVIELHTKTFPNYLRAPGTQESAADRVKKKKEEKEAKEDMAREELVDIVKLLDGKVIEEAGKEFCIYFTYTGKKRFEQKVPLTMVSSDMVKNQYQPSREKVEQLQKEGKTEY